ncbi:nucleolar Jumonji domain interacting protein, putative [Plasmodium malariae]|uniref:Nucleolar Jumonji domain interacting protein, putative n=1 Tax=Plasmodium malariae TaxID=5858 RepID=A0A1C3KDE0_PLAMA|nr:nucleolar Jumonji domain interacting protein, putative [Plasmodium malariae]
MYTPIKCKASVFDVEFHPKLDLLCAGLFDGNLILYKLKKDVKQNEEQDVEHNEDEKKKFEKIWHIYNHEKTIRCVSFSKKGKTILSASSDNKCALTDITGKVIWTNTCHKNLISSILFTSLNTFLTADEIGVIKHWDVRDKSKKPIHKIKVYDDIISSMLLDHNEKSIIVSSGGHLSHFDILYKKKISSHTISIEYKDDLLCSQLIAHNSKIVCTTINGDIIIFSKEPWGNIDGKIKASKEMINTFVKLDEYIILFGTYDGLIKAAHFHSNKVGDIIARHDAAEAIEKLTINKKKNILASISHDYSINFYPIRMNSSHISGKSKKKKKPFFRDL